MADNSLPQIIPESYNITKENLETIYFKIDQCHSTLTILSDWITECCGYSLPIEKKKLVDSVLVLNIDLMKTAETLLPEI
jgi:hypothetical protein